jgi:hypothetical protein
MESAADERDAVNLDGLAAGQGADRQGATPNAGEGPDAQHAAAFGDGGVQVHLLDQGAVQSTPTVPQAAATGGDQVDVLGLDAAAGKGERRARGGGGGAPVEATSGTAGSSGGSGQRSVSRATALQPGADRAERFRFVALTTGFDVSFVPTDTPTSHSVLVTDLATATFEVTTLLVVMRWLYDCPLQSQEALTMR